MGSVSFNVSSVGANPSQAVAQTPRVAPQTQAKHCTIGGIFKMATVGFLAFTAGNLYGSNRLNLNSVTQLTGSTFKMPEPFNRDACLHAWCFTKDYNLPFYHFDSENPLLRPRSALEKDSAERNSPTGVCLKGSETLAEEWERISLEFYEQMKNACPFTLPGETTKEECKSAAPKQKKAAEKNTDTGTCPLNGETTEQMYKRLAEKRYQIIVNNKYQPNAEKTAEINATNSSNVCPA